MGIFQQFPYTNFHELNLDWFLNEFKKLYGEWENTKNDWNNLKEFVENFFDNLDLTDEVSEKLQEMYNDGSLMVLLSVYLSWYVTPEMYGAAGDGITDDTIAFASAVNSGKPVFCYSKQYKLTDSITINQNHIFIYGNDATLNFGHNSGFIIPATGDDIGFYNCKFELEFTKDSSDESNAAIAIDGSDQNEYDAKNIIIKHCSFNGGVFGVAASSTKNLIISECLFKSFTYNQVDGAGGYGVLLQSCIDSFVEKSEFKMGKWGRHDIYVSIDRNKTLNIACKNISISECTFNHHNLEIDEDGYYYSPTTPSIVVRHSYNISVTSCVFTEVTGAVSCTMADGNIDGLKIRNCTGINPVHNDGAYEVKSFYNVTGGANTINLLIENCNMSDVPSNYQTFLTMINGTLMISNCNFKATRAVINDNVTVLANNILSEVTSIVFRFNGAGIVKGKLRNILDYDLTGAKYLRGSASFESNFFERIRNSITQSVTSNGNGNVDSNVFISGGIDPVLMDLIDSYTDINSRIITKAMYNGRYLFKIWDTSMSVAANETFNMTVVFTTVDN